MVAASVPQGTSDVAYTVAIISASAALGGVLLGQFIGAIKDYLFTRSKRKKDAEYLAIIVVSHLDRFINGCLAVAQDDGTDEYGAPSGSDGTCIATTDAPVFAPLEIEVEWKSLPRDLMYAIMRIPDKQAHLKHKWTHESYDDPPEYTEFFWARQTAYAEFGLKVSAVAERLRKYTGLIDEDTSDDGWSREQAMANIIERNNEAKAAFDARMAARVATREALSPDATMPDPSPSK